MNRQQQQQCENHFESSLCLTHACVCLVGGWRSVGCVSSMNFPIANALFTTEMWQHSRFTLYPYYICEGSTQLKGCTKNLSVQNSYAIPIAFCFIPHYIIFIVCTIRDKNFILHIIGKKNVFCDQQITAKNHYNEINAMSWN